MVEISAVDADKLVDDGKADPVKRGVLYVDRALSRPKEQAMPPEDLDSVIDEEPDQTYVTRDLQAETKPDSRRRRRQRQKNRQQSDGE